VYADGALMTIACRRNQVCAGAFFACTIRAPDPLPDVRRA